MGDHIHTEGPYDSLPCGLCKEREAKTAALEAANRELRAAFQHFVECERCDVRDGAAFCDRGWEAYQALARRDGEG